MIKVYYGDDRIRASQAIKQFLGNGYEVIDGAELEPSILPSIFMGNSLFASRRKILIRDVLDNKAVAAKIPEYQATLHDIVIQESKVPKNSVFYKSLYPKVEFKEFKLPETSVYSQALSIFNTAKKDGKKAVALLESIKVNLDPIAFTGMIVSLALKDFEKRQGTKEKRVLTELSKLDLAMKSTSLSPWTLLSSFLLRLASWQELS